MYNFSKPKGHKKQQSQMHCPNEKFFANSSNLFKNSIKDSPKFDSVESPISKLKIAPKSPAKTTQVRIKIWLKF